MIEVNGREIHGPKRLQRAETVNSRWAYVLPEDHPYTAGFEVDYWRRTAEQVKPGDVIIVMTYDRRIIYEIFCIDSNFQADPARLDLCWRAVYPPTLKVPGPVVEESRWQVRQRTTDGLFFIFDKSKNETIADGLRREAAMQQVALLENLAKETPSVKAA